MRKQVIVLLAVLSILFSFPVLNAAKVQITSETPISIGTTWSEWNEFQFSGAGTGIFWRCGYSDPSGVGFSIQLKNDNDFTVSFSSFTVGGDGWGKKTVWSGTLVAKTVFAMDGKSDSPMLGAQGDRVMVQARIEGLGKGRAESRRMESHQPQSRELKNAHNYTMNMYQKYIQAVGAGTSTNVNRGMIQKYKEGREKEEGIKCSEYSAASAPELLPTDWP